MEKGLRKRCLLLLLLLLFASSSTTLLLFKEAAPELCHIVAKSDLEMHFALHEERGHIQFIFRILTPSGVPGACEFLLNM